MLRKRVWSRDGLKRTFATVQRMLDAKFAPADLKGRMEFIHAQIFEQQVGPAALKQMLRFAYAVEALRLAAEHGGIGRSQISALVELARDTLHSNGITAGKSKLSFVYAELGTLISQVEARQGNLVRAAWEQELTAYRTKRSEPAESGMLALASAHRMARLGHGPAADAAVAAALAEEPGPALAARCRLLAARNALFGGRVADGLALLAALDAGAGAEAEERVWLLEFGKAIAAAAPAELLRAVRKDGPHYTARRVLEAHLYLMAGPNEGLLHESLHLTTLSRRPELRLRAEKHLCRAAMQLEASYDATTPLVERVAALGSVLDDVARLEAVEHELLVWAAAARWLARHQSFALARLALCQYRQLSFAMSVGREADVLGTSADLMAKPWFDERDVSPLQKLDCGA